MKTLLRLVILSILLVIIGITAFMLMTSKTPEEKESELADALEQRGYPVDDVDLFANRLILDVDVSQKVNADTYYPVFAQNAAGILVDILKDDSLETVEINFWGNDLEQKISYRYEDAEAFAAGTIDEDTFKAMWQKGS